MEPCMTQDLLATVLQDKHSNKLHKLHNLSSVRSWDYSRPTLVRGSILARKPMTTAAAFKSALFEKYPILRKISLANLAIMGGSVVSMLIDNFDSPVLDMFVVTEPKTGPTPVSAMERIEKFINDIYSFMSASNNEMLIFQERKRQSNPNFNLAANKLYPLEEFRVCRVGHVFSVCIPVLSADHYGQPTYFTIKLYAEAHTTVLDLLNSADLECSAVAYYDEEVWFTSLSKFAIENTCCIVDGTSRTPSYLARVMKYANSGFDVILPYLDVSKVRTVNFQFGLMEMLDLPHFLVTIGGIRGNKITNCGLRLADKSVTTASSTDPLRIVNMIFSRFGHSNGGFGGFGAQQGGPGASAAEHKSVLNHNLTCLMQDAMDDFVLYGDGANFSWAFRPFPLITEADLIGMYNNVSKSIYTGNPFGAANQPFYVDKLIEYFPLADPTDLVQRTIVAYLEEQKAQGSKSIVLGQILESHIAKVLAPLIDEQLAYAKQKIREMEATSDFVKVTAEQHVECTPAEFYGEYFSS